MILILIQHQVPSKLACHHKRSRPAVPLSTFVICLLSSLLSVIILCCILAASNKRVLYHVVIGLSDESSGCQWKPVSIDWWSLPLMCNRRRLRVHWSRRHTVSDAWYRGKASSCCVMSSQGWRLLQRATAWVRPTDRHYLLLLTVASTKLVSIQAQRLACFSNYLLSLLCQ